MVDIKVMRVISNKAKGDCKNCNSPHCLSNIRILFPKVVLVSYEVESNEYQSGVVKQGPQVALLSILSCRLWIVWKKAL